MITLITKKKSGYLIFLPPVTLGNWWFFFFHRPNESQPVVG